MSNDECRMSNVGPSLFVIASAFVIRHSSFVSMSLSRAEVERISLLGRLRLSEQELETMTTQLAQVVDYVAQLAELNTDEVTPMAHAVDVANVFRADEVQ